MSLTAHHLYLVAPGGAPDDIRRFYGEALGLEAVRKPDSLAHTPVLWFAIGTILLHVGHPDQGIVGDGHTALASPDLGAVRARLSALGYVADDNVIPMGYPRFYVRDPWGNQIEILPEGLP